ncbi:thiazole/oxazole-forming peptide maturase SagD family component [Kibdelosporangium banguiense]|uniref:Thiazole/oxazole-forming peptide maturase SagD family component n=1 Tax=Kibdelosporangium banguiense TaxID=1365924 RepID=A0ABS4TU66_9PSEU|nr:YcaO-like family protein [Kibdelosporangium banguiense]MBP2327942.1 thiazole/oxazole-forming peptide maturase SagD family component [Kibdelosporangium banguiense]
MAADSTRVTVMSDHALLYAHPDTFSRLDFLTGSAKTRAFAASAPSGNPDLRADLTKLINRYLETGLDVIVVDQTTLEHRAGGFTCVKVLIPGTVPMTFGHANRRTANLPRLHTVPPRLGSQPSGINPHPHPFP